MSWVLAAAGGVGLLGLAGPAACSDAANGRNPAEMWPGCIDGDGDGFGQGCAKGPDCDDSDPLVAEDCVKCPHPGVPGCPCTSEGQSAQCGAPVEGSGGKVCEHGETTCAGGAWSACKVTSVTLAPGGGLSPQGLGGSSKCPNSCDPFCQVANKDTPSDLGSPDSGIVSTEAGLTLGQSGGCAPSANSDIDGDGWTPSTGDCNDCNKYINPGAYDYPANGIDENCDGTADNEVQTCDAGLTLGATGGADYVKAIDLCKFTDAAATGAAKTWGVINGSSALVRANGSSAPVATQSGIMPYFGNNTYNNAKLGANLAVFSSGTARFPGQAGYVTPKGWCGSKVNGTTSSVPCGLGWYKAGCPAANPGNDSAGLKFQVRAPTNAGCFSFRFHFFSSEYPEWVCTSYNDTFIAMLTNPSMVPGTGCCGSAPNVNCNISYDANKAPVSVNNAFFSVPGCKTCSSPVLSGTGFDGSCSGYIKGGSTNWLYSYAPVTPGQIATLHYSIWDTGDMVWDSTVLIDAFTWYPGTCTIGTSPGPPPPGGGLPPMLYTEGWFVRDYDLSGSCPPNTKPQWGIWTWQSTDPVDARIEFDVATATTKSGLDTATPTALLFSNPQGPAALVGKPTVAKLAVPDTQNGAADVNATLVAKGLATANSYLRIRSHLVPSTDKTKAPLLTSWSQQFTCIP